MTKTEKKKRGFQTGAESPDNHPSLVPGVVLVHKKFPDWKVKVIGHKGGAFHDCLILSLDVVQGYNFGTLLTDYEREI